MLEAINLTKSYNGALPLDALNSVRPDDAAVIAAAVAVLASLRPAIRATTIGPLMALRQE
jgi:hypothetical protein